MPKVDLGEKQMCPSCGAKFYDLKRRPAVCPKCQTAFDPTDEVVRARRVKSRTTAFAGADTDEEEVTAQAEEAVVEGFEDEPDETPELDTQSAEVEALSELEDEDGPETPDDELADGFSEDDGVDVGEGDDAPFLVDDDEFGEDALDEIPDEDGKDNEER